MSSLESLDTFMADQALREQNDRLKEALEECKSQLNELLHEDKKVSDATIKNDYLSLCESIETWIGSVSYSEEKDFNTRFREVLQEERKKPRGWLADLDQPQDRENSNETRSNFWMDLLGNQNSCNCVVLSVVIWTHIYTKVFKEYFPIGTMKDKHLRVERVNNDSGNFSIPGHATLLEDIMNIMEDTYQNQDASRRINKWRSETLTAMVATSAFTRRQEEYWDTIFEELLTKLEHWISPVTLSNNQDELLKDIVVPAVKLHQAMSCSSTKYELRHPEFERGIALEQPAPWTAKNIETWTQTSSTDLDWVPFQHQFPGLYRLDKFKKLELIRPVVIVFKEQILRNPTPSPAPRDPELPPNVSKRLPPDPPDTIESSQSDSQRSSRKSKSKSKSKERKKKHPENLLQVMEGLECSSGNSKSRKGSVVKDSKQTPDPHDRSSPSKSHGQRPRRNKTYDEPKSPRPRTPHHLAMAESQPAPPERVKTYPGAPGQRTQEGDQIVVQEEYEDSRVRGQPTVYDLQAPKSPVSNQAPEAPSGRHERQKSVTDSVVGAIKNIFTTADSPPVDRFTSSRYGDSVSISQGPMRQPPRDR